MFKGLLSPKRAIALALVVVVTIGVTVASIMLDDHADRRRPMYRALVTMQGLQWDLLKAGKPGLPLVAKHGGRPRVINGHAFVVPPGVTVRVEERNGQTCVFAENRFGDHSRWECIDMSYGRPSPGGLA